MGRHPRRHAPPEGPPAASTAAVPLLLLLALALAPQPAAAHSPHVPRAPRPPRPPPSPRKLDPQGCAALATHYDIVPGSSWGTAGPTVQQRWTTSDCDALICVYYRTKYNVVPFLSWGSLSEALKPAWDFRRTASGRDATCNNLSGPLDYQGCGLLVDKEGILPGVSWGSATPDEQSLYTQSDCDAKVCAYWKEKHGVVPYSSWGSLPGPLQPAWDRPRAAHGNKTCNSLASPGGLDTASCGGLVDSLGVKPGFSWGTAGQEARELYASSSCDFKVCEYWRAKYGVVPYGSWGSLPAELWPSWELPRASRKNATCNSLSGPLDPYSCAALVKAYSVRPGFSMGSAPPEARAMYSSSNCVVKVCEAWKAQYGVVPYKTYGTLPETLKASWDYPRPTMKGRTCNSLAGPLSPSDCGAMVEVFGIVPGPTTAWGTATPEARAIFSSSECEVRVCAYWKTRYGIVPGSSWGTMPEYLRPAWDYPRPSRNGQNCNTLYMGNY